jgi:hypothetical protein
MKHESFSNFFFLFAIPDNPIGWGSDAWLPKWGRLTSVGHWPPPFWLGSRLCRLSVLCVPAVGMRQDAVVLALREVPRTQGPVLTGQLPVLSNAAAEDPWRTDRKGIGTDPRRRDEGPSVTK